MIRFRIVQYFYYAFLFAFSGVGSAQPSPVRWQDVGPGLSVVIGENWGPIRFSAVKFHLGYYKINLVDARAYRDKNVQKIRTISDNSKFSNELLDAGIETIFKTWPDQSELIAVAPAGWSTSLRRIENAGLLKISGRLYSDFEVRGALSAILCLNSPLPSVASYDYQVPVFYKVSEPHQLKLGESCSDAVQAGPTIIEDPNKTDDQRGITQAETSLRPQLRVIFAVDDPGRGFPPKTRESARNAYLIVTETPVHLWDVQKMLLSPDFYGSGSKPHWAINMAGGGPSGLVMRGADKNPIIVGNPAGIIGSAFVITSRLP